MLTKTDAVVEKIVGRIRSQELVAGERLPASEALAAEYGVGRGTARSALERLFGQGLIYKRGKSWYIERRVKER